MVGLLQGRHSEGSCLLDGGVRLIFEGSGFGWHYLKTRYRRGSLPRSERGERSQRC